MLAGQLDISLQFDISIEEAKMPASFQALQAELLCCEAKRNNCFFLFPPGSGDDFTLNIAFSFWRFIFVQIEAHLGKMSLPEQGKTNYSE